MFRPDSKEQINRPKTLRPPSQNVSRTRQNKTVQNQSSIYVQLDDSNKIDKSAARDFSGHQSPQLSRKLLKSKYVSAESSENSVSRP